MGEKVEEDFSEKSDNENNGALKDNDGKRESIQDLFGRNVKKYRKAARLTQEQLSEKLGISQKHLSIIETGTQFASASLIGRISETLKISPGELFGGANGDMKREIEKMRDEIMSLVSNEIRRQNDALFERMRTLFKRTNAPDFPQDFL